jgi:small neutral amino acid transporter SnatA (MarC family)
MSVAITLGANTPRTHIDLWAFITATVIAVTLVAVSIYFCYRFAENMARLLGRNGTSIFSSPVLLHPALHRCADFLERRPRVVGFISQ